MAIVAALAVVLAHWMSGVRTPARYQPFTAEERRAGMDRVISEVVLEDATFARAVELLEKKAGTRISIEPGEEARRGGLTWESFAAGRVTLRLRDVTLAQALGIMSFLYLPESEAEFVATPSGRIELRYWPQVVTRRHDVREVRRQNSSQVHAAPGTATRDPVEDLTSAIRQGVDPDGWRENGGSVGTISWWVSRLVIGQTPENHRRIEQLLAAMRETLKTKK